MTDQKQRAYSEWLVIRYQQGDRPAFDQLCRLWERRFLLYAVRRLEEKENARDVTQEALLSMSKGLHRLGDPGAFPGWAFRILERRCVDFQRSRIRERQVIAESSALLDDAPEMAQSDNTENQINVQELMGMLDAKVRAVLQLHYLEGFTVSEIASILDIPAGTIKSRLFYARKMLAGNLNQTTQTPQETKK